MNWKSCLIMLMPALVAAKAECRPNPEQDRIFGGYSGCLHAAFRCGLKVGIKLLLLIRFLISFKGGINQGAFCDFDTHVCMINCLIANTNQSFITCH